MGPTPKLTLIIQFLGQLLKLLNQEIKANSDLGSLCQKKLPILAFNGHVKGVLGQGKTPSLEFLTKTQLIALQKQLKCEESY